MLNSTMEDIIELFDETKKRYIATTVKKDYSGKITDSDYDTIERELIRYVDMIALAH